MTKFYRNIDQFAIGLLYNNDKSLVKFSFALKKHETINAAHYANTPMQYTAIFHGCENFNFHMKNVIFFLFLLKTLIVGMYTLEPPQ